MSPAFYLSPKGRVSRSQFWLKLILPYIGAVVVAGLVDGFIGTFDEESGIGLLTVAVMILAIWPATVVSIKRLHDLGVSGWYLLSAFVPIWNLWSSLRMHFVEGAAGNNYYGPDPREVTASATPFKEQAEDTGSLIG